jgi:hypothetical protein
VKLYAPELFAVVVAPEVPFNVTVAPDPAATGLRVPEIVNVCGVVALLTVTVTTALMVLFPAASRAIAPSLCAPLLAFVVSHEYAYGADASKPPALIPSTWNCTLATPTLSAAFAETLTVPETLAPAAGALIDTVGGVVSADVLLIVTVTAALVVLFPAPSFAMALNTCDPLLVFVVSHV